MALSTKERDILDNQLPINQQTGLGTELYNLQQGVGAVYPTSDPSVAGEVWANSGVLTVSAG